MAGTPPQPSPFRGGPGWGLNDTRVKDIVILGGGTAGWLAALYLYETMVNDDEVRFSITVIESPAIGILGAGEAATFTLKKTLDYLRISESEWMPECNATFKMAFKPVNWTGANEAFWHPFYTGE